MLTSVAKSVSANLADSIPSPNDLDTYEQWRRWVESESQRRIIYCIYGENTPYVPQKHKAYLNGTVIECCYWIFKDVPSSMTLDDLKIALPCKDILWTSDFEMSQKHSLANPGKKPSHLQCFS